MLLQLLRSKRMSQVAPLVNQPNFTRPVSRSAFVYDNLLSCGRLGGCFLWTSLAAAHGGGDALAFRDGVNAIDAT